MQSVVLFDLDGTLIDHFNVLYRCYCHALSRLELPVPTAETVRRSVGGSMEVTMRRFADAERYPAAVQLWREHFDEIFLQDVSLMPGADWLLRGLHRRRARLAVFTNKNGHCSRQLCQHLQLESLIEAVFGAQDTPHRKPMPEFSRHVLDQLGADASATCLVGDSPFDIEAARAGGFPCYCVPTGSHDQAQLRAAGAAGVYEDLFALGRQVFRLTD